MKLFDPISIRDVQVRNRIVMAPMTTRLANINGFATEQSIQYYSARAKGGVGLVTVEMSGVDPGGAHRKRESAIHDDAYIPGLRKLTESVKAHGARVGIQLAHGGAQALSRVTGHQAVAPSSIPYTVNEIVTETHVPKELTLKEIDQIIRRFSDAADRAKRSGFDTIEIHGAHGYLIYQFLSPLTNKRTDVYGGGLEGRAKFAIEVVRAVRERVSDMPVIFRISAEEFAEGGLKIEDSIEVCKWLETAGVDGIHVSGGSYLSTYTYMVPPMMLPPGCFLYLAEKIKEAVGVPVITAGRLHYPLLAETAIMEGKTDMVVLGRQLLADPEWPNKVRDGRLDEVRRCLSCNYCIEAMRDGACVECMSNVQVGREWLSSGLKDQGGNR